MIIRNCKEVMANISKIEQALEQIKKKAKKRGPELQDKK